MRSAQDTESISRLVSNKNILIFMSHMVVQDDHKSSIGQSFHSRVKNLSRC